MGSDSQQEEPLVPRPRGLARATRVSGVRRRQQAVLTRDAEACLFEHARVLTEGQLRENSEGYGYDGSTMVTFDLRPLADLWRGTFDEAARRELLDLVQGSVRVRIRVLRIARREASRRLVGYRLGTMRSDTQVRLEGSSLLLDVDFEAEVQVCSAMVEP